MGGWWDDGRGKKMFYRDQTERKKSASQLAGGGQGTTQGTTQGTMAPHRAPKAPHRAPKAHPRHPGHTHPRHTLA